MPGVIYAAEITCLACDSEMRFGMSMTDPDAVPEPGSFMICGMCATVMRLVDVGPPAKLRLTTNEDNEDMVAAGVNRARQAILDHLRLKEFTRGADSEEEVQAILASLPPGKHAVISGWLCSDGPPPRKWRKTMVRALCGRCRQPIWLRHPPPAGVRYVGCAGCLAQTFMEEGKRLA